MTSKEKNLRNYLKWLYYRDPDDPFDQLGPSFKYQNMPDPPNDWRPFEYVGDEGKKIAHHLIQIISGSNPWEIILDGDMGLDIVGTYQSWEDAHKALKEWFKDFTKNKVNPNEEDNKGISEDARRQDHYALEDIENAKENERWSFHFSHDNHAYTVCLQPVGYKED